MKSSILTLATALILTALPSLAARPNIILIMADDMGFSDIGCYGSEIETPNLDRLAGHGLRFTHFYNTARCCPTRASLMTGLYAHRAGMGSMTKPAEGFPGYQGEISENTATIAEVLKSAGYATFMSGKWHLTTDDGKKPDGPRYNWPRQRGFDRFFGTIAGAGSFFTPATLTRDDTVIDQDFPKDFYYTRAISKNMATYIREHHERKPDQPFFGYVAYTASHWPLHALPEDIAKYRGKYRAGWDKLREERHERQIALGIVKKKWPMSVRHPDAPAWDELDDEQKNTMDLKMAIYAAMIDRMDRGIGRIVKALQETGDFENTLIFFLADNGGCDETGLYGFDRGESKAKDKLGTDDSFASYGLCWANASNTPFQFFKKDNHEGGISTPLIVHWPKGGTGRSQLRHQPAHVIDIMATCVDVAEAKYPEQREGNPVHPLQGQSLVPVFKDESIDRKAIYWEHVGNRAIRVGDWKLVSNTRFRGDEWELYNLAEDRTELNNLAAENPEKAKQLEKMWLKWAEANGVWPKPGQGKKKKVK